MDPVSWKKELATLPPIDFNRVASEPVRLVLAGLAERDGLPIEKWLDLRLRSMAAMAMPTTMRESIYEHMTRMHRGLSSTIDYPALSMPQYADDVPSDTCFWFGVNLLGSEIRAVLKRSREQQAKAGTASKGEHLLWRKPTIDRTQEFARDDRRAHWGKTLTDMGPYRKIVRVTSAMQRRVEQLLIDAPNCKEATLFVLGQLALARRSGRELKIPPLLLVGPPAAGKTWWAERLGLALRLHCECITLPSVTASFELSGGSRQWYSGTPGQIAKAFLRTDQASPLFVLDEIDKAPSENRYPVAASLLGLIDRSAAVRWRDEFFDQEFNVSRALFIATANYPERMDAALRSRFRRIDVRAPIRSERASMIASVWREYRSLSAGVRLPRSLTQEVVDTLVDQFQDARQLLRLFDDALGRAARRPGPLRILPSDVGGPPAWLAARSPDRPP